MRIILYDDFFKKKSVKVSKFEPFFQWKILCISWNHIFKVKIWQKFTKRKSLESSLFDWHIGPTMHLWWTTQQQCHIAQWKPWHKSFPSSYYIYLMTFESTKDFTKIIVLGWLINIDYLHVIWKTWNIRYRL
jgi:hypothetical protein